MMAFKPTSKKLDVNHLDGNKGNNKLNNLQWATRSENVRHAFKNGLNPKGLKHGHSKWTEKQIKEVKLLLVFNLPIKIISEKTGVGESTIRRIKKGERYCD